MRWIATMAALAATAGLAGCSTSDWAYMTESYPDQTVPDDYVQCPTGTVVLQTGITGGQAYNRAINNTRKRISVNFNSRFGGGNLFYAEPGGRTETLWRSPVDAQNAGVQVQCEA